MAKTRPKDDRPGARVLADYPLMGEPTVNDRPSHSVASPKHSVGSVQSDGTMRGPRRAHTRAPRAALADVRETLRFPGRPKLWIEILLIAAAYWIYSLVRNAAPEQRQSAMRHASQIWDLEQQLGIGLEKTVNHGIDSVTWLIVGMNYYYATLHFVVTIGVLAWLFRAHPGRYAPARLTLFATTAMALVGYYFYPLAPPRLMRNVGFLDTVVLHHTWGSMASGDLANVSNQYAAMPSMHIGWSLWCGITIAVLAKRTWVKVLGCAYPLLTLTVIVATANHFWLDAVGGMACLAVGFAVAYVIHGRLPYRFPRQPLSKADVEAASSESGSGSGSSEAPPEAGSEVAATSTTGDPGAPEARQPESDPAERLGQPAGPQGRSTGAADPGKPRKKIPVGTR